MTRARIAPLVLLLALATCARQDMFVQQCAAPWGAFSFLPHGMTMQAPVTGHGGAQRA